MRPRRPPPQPQPTSSPSTYHRIAEASRLRVSEDHAAHLVHAAGCGTTLTLIAMPEDRRDSALSHTAREAVIAAITTDAPAPIEPGPIAAAVALPAALPQTTALAIAEVLAGENALGRLIDYGVLLPHAQTVYELAAADLQEPTLLSFISDGNLIYAWPYEDRQAWAPERSGALRALIALGDLRLTITRRDVRHPRQTESE